MKTIKDVYNRSNKPIGDIDFIALSGHVCKMSEPKAYEKWNVKWKDRELPMIPEHFKIEPLRIDILNKIRSSLDSVHYDAIIVGTDSDVEGNGIYDLLETYLGLQDIKAYRFFESDLTPGGIMKSIQNMTDYHTDLRDIGMTKAYRIRSRFDWLIGFNMSVAYTVKSGFLMKVGRVKAPTLKLVYDNCASIDNFSSKTAYQPSIEAAGIAAGLVDNDNKMLSYPDRTQAEDVIRQLSGVLTVKSVEKEIKKSVPNQLYKLTDIQYEAGLQYGYTPEKTLELIQSLYETHKLISYPRTDSRYVSSEKAEDFPRLLKAVAAMNSLSNITIDPAAIAAVKKNRRYVNDAEVQKSSHDALLPTGETAALNRLNKDERNICEMIFRRFLAIFLPPLEEEKTKLLFEDNGYRFLKNGSKIISHGYTILYKKPQESILPEIKEKTVVKEDRQFLHEVVSRPPRRFTQASLLKEMENISKYINEDDLRDAMKKAQGIGQPSSRAAIITELVDTGYVKDVKGKGLFITDQGKAYIENLGNSSIVSPKLSAEWEMHMSDIREGSVSYEKVYTQILDYLQEALMELDHIQFKKAFRKERKQIGICPVCGKSVVELPKGYGCSGYPECKFSIFKQIAGRTMRKKDIINLLTKGTTGELSGFKSRDGKPFSAELIIKDGQVSWAPFEKPTDIQCPKCGKYLVQSSMAYKCLDDNCGFILWKNICGHKLSENEVHDLLKDGRTKVITGFKSKKGNKFSARLIMRDFKLKFEFEEAKKTDITCPKCGNTMVKTSKSYKCSAENCDFIIWTTISEKTLSDSDVRDLVDKGKTQVLDGFTSKKGKEFSARIALKDWRTCFEFENTNQKPYKGKRK